jgi:hypothetical protein
LRPDPANGFLIARRTVLLDQTNILSRNLSNFL